MGEIGEVVPIDGQEVAYEIEVIDTINDIPQFPPGDGITEEIKGNQLEEFHYIDNGEYPSTSEQEYYEPIVEDQRFVDNEGNEYIYDPETNTYHQIQYEIKTMPSDDVVLPVDEGPSTSGVIDFEEPVELLEPEEEEPSFVLKRNGKRKHVEVVESQQNQQFEFEQCQMIPAKQGKKKKMMEMRVVQPFKMEDGAILKKLCSELSKLRRDNEQLRSEHEQVCKRLTQLITVHDDTKRRFTETDAEKKNLVKTLTKLRVEKKKILNSIEFESSSAIQLN
ncbi:unnamed protein product [Caenorhabditis bovis]|uniref:Uncharacterized protein n=1 Tax=Caenorhabditis bovis TaxID=2654633 RepID=A0A8S1F3K4_9PELO|nr:unnamed protein product [Caenorhabditis bovis]